MLEVWGGKTNSAEMRDVSHSWLSVLELKFCQLQRTVKKKREGIYCQLPKLHRPWCWGRGSSEVICAKVVNLQLWLYLSQLKCFISRDLNLLPSLTFNSKWEKKGK